MKKSNEKGVTLIMLIIIIIVVFILAGTTINGIIKPNSMLNTAEDVQNKEKENANKQTNETTNLINNATENMKDKVKDLSGANSPKLTEDMIPVKWVEGSGWVVTDETDEEWYNYKEKKMG